MNESKKGGETAIFSHPTQSFWEGLLLDVNLFCRHADIETPADNNNET